MPDQFHPRQLLRDGRNLPDPWKRYESWRYTGPFSRYQRFRGLFPGFGIASVAFAGYCAYEWAFLSDRGAHGHGHSEGGGEHH